MNTPSKLSANLETIAFRATVEATWPLARLRSNIVVRATDHDHACRKARRCFVKQGGKGVVVTEVRAA